VALTAGQVDMQENNDLKEEFKSDSLPVFYKKCVTICFQI